MTLTIESAGVLIPGTKLSEVVMEMKTVRVLRKFYINGVIQEVGKTITVSETEARGLVASNKAEIVPEPPPVEKAAKKEEPKTEVPKAKEPTSETKKGGK